MGSFRILCFSQVSGSLMSPRKEGANVGDSCSGPPSVSSWGPGRGPEHEFCFPFFWTESRLSLLGSNRSLKAEAPQAI